MKKGKRKNNILSLLMAVIIFISSFLAIQPAEVFAASKYIKVDAFIKLLVTSINLTVDTSVNDPYLVAAKNVGILRDGDFTKYTGYLTRTDAVVLLNRADEYLHGDTVDVDLLQIVLEKRISDINSISESKREAVAKVFVKGIIQGYSNGYYIQNRSFKGSDKLTKTDAKILISKVVNTSKRAKLSPDGQLIRTTNLPKYAKYYPYILASFPNAYYDWKFEYEGQVKVNPQTGVKTPYVKFEEYASPADIDKITDFDNFKEVKDQYLGEWVNKVQTYMECVFNADYRTIDDKWINKILSADYSYGHENIANQTAEKIEQYINKMKENKTVVESAKIAVDGSSLYYFAGRYYLRVYVKYRIVSSNLKFGADADTLIYENPYSKILYTRYSLVSLNSYILGKWKECCFDVDLSWYSMKEPYNIGVVYAYLNEVYYEKRRVDK